MQSLFWNSDENRIRSFWRILVFIAIALAMILIYNVVALQWMNPFLRSAFQSTFMFLSAFYAIYLISKYFAKQEMQTFGFKMDGHWFYDFVMSSFLAITLMAAIFLTGYITGSFIVTDSFYTQFDHSFFVSFISRIPQHLGTGLWEEAVFRGFLIVTIAQGLVGKKLNWNQAVWIAVIFTSFLFGFAHILNPNASIISSLNISLAGIFVAVPFIYSGRLGFSVGLHMFWNMAQNNFFGFPNSGNISNTSIILTTDQGPAWLTGGTFGPEAGFLGTCAFIIGTILSIALLQKHYKKIELRVFPFR